MTTNRGADIVSDMTKQEAILHFGTQAKLAEKLGLKQPTVAGWILVPLEHQNYLEKLTCGALKADPHPAERADNCLSVATDCQDRT